MEETSVFVDATAVRFSVATASIRGRDRVDRGSLGLWSALEDQGFSLYPLRRELRNSRGELMLNPYMLGLGSPFAEVAARTWGLPQQRPAIAAVRLPIEALEFSWTQRWCPASFRWGDVGVYIPALQAVLRRHGWGVRLCA